MFDTLLTDLREGVTQAINRLLINVQVQRQQQAQQSAVQEPRGQNLSMTNAPIEIMDGAPPSAPIDNNFDMDSLKSVSRNAPCPCGSGKKVKHCHGKA